MARAGVCAEDGVAFFKKTRQRLDLQCSGQDMGRNASALSLEMFE
jgi:hypothetical protein